MQIDDISYMNCKKNHDLKIFYGEGNVGDNNDHNNCHYCYVTCKWHINLIEEIHNNKPYKVVDIIK